MRRPLKGTTACIAAAIVTTSAPHAADSLVDAKSIPGTFSANVGLFSEYYFRGVSQTNDAPALQGGMDWAELGYRRHLLHISGCEPVAELRFHRRAGGAVIRFRIRIGNREPELFARQFRRLRHGVLSQARNRGACWQVPDAVGSGRQTIYRPERNVRLAGLRRIRARRNGQSCRVRRQYSVERHRHEQQRVRRCLRHGAVERFTIILRLNHRSSPAALVFIYPDTSITEGTGA